MGCICSKGVSTYRPLDDHDHDRDDIVVGMDNGLIISHYQQNVCHTTTRNHNNHHHSHHTDGDVGECFGGEIQSEIIPHSNIARVFKDDYLPSVSTLNPVNRVKYDSSLPISQYLHQFLLYSCNIKTVAHFPLMNEEHAIRSKLFKRAGLAYDISSMVIFQLYDGRVFILVILKSPLLIKMYAWDIHGKTFHCYIGLTKDTDIVWHPQTLLTLSKYMDSLEYNKMSCFLLNFVSEDIDLDESQKRMDAFNIMQTMASASSRICSFAASMSKDFVIYLLPVHCSPLCSSFTALRTTYGQSIKIKLVTARNAGYLPEPTSFLALDSDLSSNGSEYTREDLRLLLVLPIPKTNNLDTCSKALLNPCNKQCLSHGTESVLVGGLGISELLEELISVRFEEKPQSEQEDILLYLYMNWQDLQQDSSVIEALKETKFVKDADGVLHKPKHLFDPADELLASVFYGEAHKFPGERFVSDRWLNILRKIGLQNTSGADVVLECARRVECLGAESMKHAGLVDNYSRDFSETTTEVSAEIWSLAEILIKVVFEKFGFLNGHNFCSMFGKIACVPAEFGFPFESGKKGVKKVLCSYSEAILLKDWPLAWSVAPILTRESLIPPEYSWGDLQIRSPPPFTIVLKHLMADVLRRKPALLFIEEASFEVLKYLDTIWGTLSSSDVAKLQDIALIPVANTRRIVSCNCLFSRWTRDLRPLAFELPLHYLPFVKVLKALGLQEMLSISSAMMILSSLRNSCRHHRLSPNELRAVIEILHFLCNETIDQHISERSDWESKLVVPDNDCRLVRPNSCVYIDSFGSRYVKYIDASKLRFVHDDVSERLCLAFGIRKLSDVVVEELDCVEHLQTVEEIGSISLAAIRLKLLNRSFQVTVLSVFNSVLSSTGGSKTPDFQTLRRSLKWVAQRLQFVKCVYVRFWLLPKSLDITRASKESIIPEWEIGSSHRALYFVDRSKTCMLIAEPPSYVSVPDLVALVVSHVLGSPVPLPIGSLLLCPRDSETALVNILQLSSDERVMDDGGRGTGFLGRSILPQDAMQVHLKLLRPFYEGEMVAWQRQKGGKLKYGRIPKAVKPSPWQTLYRFNIETSPGKTETIISSHVFWFGNLAIGSKSSTHEMPKNAMCFEQPDRSGRVKLRNKRQGIIEHRGRVSAEEFVQAVEEMLSGAGIGMDTEMHSLRQTTLSLQEQLKESQAALLVEQEKSEMATNEADKAKAALLCRICLTHDIDITVVPCGHVLCHRCLSVVSHCPFCRAQPSTTIKMCRP